MNLETELINQGLILTAIGLGTAFGLLIVLMISIQVSGWIIHIQDRRAKKEQDLALERHDKSIAAIAAVSLLLQKHDVTTDTEVK